MLDYEVYIQYDTKYTLSEYMPLSSTKFLSNIIDNVVKNTVEEHISGPLIEAGDFARKVKENILKTLNLDVYLQPDIPHLTITSYYNPGHLNMGEPNKLYITVEDDRCAPYGM